MRLIVRIVLALVAALAAVRTSNARSLVITATIVPIAVYGIATINDSLVRSGSLVLSRAASHLEVPIAGNGRFLLPYLTAGTYRATIAAHDTICSTNVQIPRIHAMRTDLGEIACRTQAVKP
jgi:hypothetical protein